MNRLPKVLVIGLDHLMQRSHPDDQPEDKENRETLEARLHEVIRERNVTLIAEEAGNDVEVATHLQKELDQWRAQLGQPSIKVESQETVAKRAAAQYKHCRHVDIRPPGSWEDMEKKYEDRMFKLVLGVGGTDESILVICGENHRERLSRLFAELGWEVENHAWVDS